MDIDRLVTRVAARLRASVVLVDRAFALVTYSAQSPTVDEDRVQSILTRSCPPGAREWYEQFGIADATRPVLTPANPDIGASARICLPARYAGRAYGYLFVLPEDTSATEDADLDAVMALAGQAGAQLAHAAGGQEDLAVSVADLLEGDEVASAHAVPRIEKSGILTEGAPLTVVAVDGLTPPPGPRTLSAPVGPLTAMIASGSDTETDPVRHLSDRAAHAGALVGVGGSCSDLWGARRSWQQAKLAVNVGRHSSRLGAVTFWKDLGVYRLASCAPPEVLADAVLTSSVQALLEHPNADLLATAQAYLDHAGDTAATAAALGIHRQTLYYRLAKIEKVTSLQLATGLDRLELHIGLTLGRFVTDGRSDAAEPA